MKSIKVLVFILLLVMPSVALADLTEEDPEMQDNTGALAGAGEATTSVDIIQDMNASGTKEGEITLRKSDEGVEVFSGLAKVENIPTGSDGWTGALDVQSSHILYTPAGRPQLSCPGQSLSGWYGPCKIANSVQ